MLIKEGDVGMDTERFFPRFDSMVKLLLFFAMQEIQGNLVIFNACVYKKYMRPFIFLCIVGGG